MSEIIVVPTVLTVSDVLVLPDNLLVAFVNISSKIITNYINLFIEKYEGSTGDEGIVADKLKKAYAEVNDRDRFLESENLKKTVNELRSLKFEDINVANMGRFKDWKQSILLIMNDKRAMANVPAIKIDTYEKALDEFSYIIEEMGEGNEDRKRIIKIKNSIVNKRSWFINDSTNPKNSMTIIHSITRKKDDFDLILYGINYLEEAYANAKQRAINEGFEGVPMSWRYL